MLIGMRNAMFGGAKLSAKSYVQDGLIGMWDGIENAGWGKHDANAITWVDLSGSGRDATLSGSYSWGENYWGVKSLTDKGLAQWDGRNLGSNQTIEFLFEQLAGGYYGRIIAEGQAVASPCAVSNKIHLYGYGVEPSTAVSMMGLHKHTITHPSGGPVKYYVDGVLRLTANTNYNSTGATTAYFGNKADYTRGLNGNYYTMRRYNRVLTADEIAANYAVDKARFNLPAAT